MKKFFGSSVISFFSECAAELKKVTWPSKDDVTAQTIIVVVSLAVVAVSLALIDYGSREFVGFIIDRAGS